MLCHISLFFIVTIAYKYMTLLLSTHTFTKVDAIILVISCPDQCSELIL